MEQTTDSGNLQQTASQTQTATAAKKTGLVPLKRLKFETGLIVLFVAMAAMVALVFLDVFFSARADVERTLISSAFEAFKLIAVSVLGYVFGTTNTGASDN